MEGANDSTRIDGLEDRLDELENDRLATIESSIDDLSSGWGAYGDHFEVEVDEADTGDTDVFNDESVVTFVINGANLAVRDGQGASSPDGEPTNGRGNLIVGYDEGEAANKTGSHNLVVGPNHTYTSWGGLVQGSEHAVMGRNAAAIGGENKLRGHRGPWRWAETSTMWRQTSRAPSPDRATSWSRQTPTAVLPAVESRRACSLECATPFMAALLPLSPADASPPMPATPSGGCPRPLSVVGSWTWEASQPWPSRAETTS